MVATSEKEKAHAVAREQFVHIRELVLAHAAAQSLEEEQAATEAILKQAPQIAVRSNWHSPREPQYVSEYRILLSAGSPSVQIIGDIEEGEPYTARLGYQAWFTRWEECELTEEEEQQLLTYAGFFTYDN